MELIQLKTAWGSGIIDKHTFIWGEDMDEWAPIGMVYGLEKAIATWEGLSLQVMLTTYQDYSAYELVFQHKLIRKERFSRNPGILKHMLISI